MLRLSWTKLLDNLVTPKPRPLLLHRGSGRAARFVEGLPIEPLGDAEADLMESGDKGIVIVSADRQKTTASRVRFCRKGEAQLALLSKDGGAARFGQLAGQTFAEIVRERHQPKTLLGFDRLGKVPPHPLAKMRTAAAPILVRGTSRVISFLYGRSRYRIKCRM